MRRVAGYLLLEFLVVAKSLNLCGWEAILMRVSGLSTLATETIDYALTRATDD
jgi:hypothetical protein